MTETNWSSHKALAADQMSKTLKKPIYIQAHVENLQFDSVSVLMDISIKKAAYPPWPVCGIIVCWRTG